MKLSSLSVCIPAYKDQDSIEIVVKEAREVARRVAYRFEIVVINDGSPDNTKNRLIALQRRIPELRVLHHKKNCGYGRTIRELYYTGKYDWIFTIPGDHQIQAKEIIKLIPSVKKADIIIGWRKHRLDTPSRQRQSAIYNALLRTLFGIRFHDVNSVRLMRKTVMQHRTLMTASSFVDAELTISALRDGLRVVEIPIVHKKRRTSGASGGKFTIIFPVILDMVRYFIKTL